RPWLLPGGTQLPQNHPSSSSMSGAFPLTDRARFSYEKKHLTPPSSRLVSAHGAPPLRRRRRLRSRKYCILPDSSQNSPLQSPALSYPLAPRPDLPGSGLLLLLQIPEISDIPLYLPRRRSVPGFRQEGIFLIDPERGLSFLVPRDEGRSLVLQAAFYRKDLAHRQFLRHINVFA